MGWGHQGCYGAIKGWVRATRDTYTVPKGWVGATRGCLWGHQGFYGATRGWVGASRDAMGPLRDVLG